jgi:hypothetical protein
MAIAVWKYCALILLLVYDRLGHGASGIGHGASGIGHGKNSIDVRITFKELV